MIRLSSPTLTRWYATARWEVIIPLFMVALLIILTALSALSNAEHYHKTDNEAHIIAMGEAYSIHDYDCEFGVLKETWGARIKDVNDNNISCQLVKGPRP